MRLGILDPSPVPAGGSPAAVLRDSLALASAAESMGYERYWLTEHHNAPGFASAAPEALVGPIAAVTRRMRVGSGGVLLRHYSPLKVAETFRTLEALFPGRIELGIGRGVGADSGAAAALRPDAPSPNTPEDDAQFLARVTELLALLAPDGAVNATADAAAPPLPPLQAVPADAGTPTPWLLGSGKHSAAFAAHLGCAFSFAHFVNPEAGPAIAREYRRRFRPGRHLDEPHVSVAVWAACAERESDVAALRAVLALWLVRSGGAAGTGRATCVPSVDEARAHRYSAEEEALLRGMAGRVIVGTPGRVRADLRRLGEAYDSDEVLLMTACHGLEMRRRSYELIAECFDLPARVRAV